ncbi:MAG: hypothetical protein ACNS63_11930 [Candidatus Nitrospinota bacterium M3_3B_026]
MRNSLMDGLIFAAVYAVLVMGSLSASPALGYSYAQKEDPMAALFKNTVAAARGGDWGVVEKNVNEGIALQKGHIFEADFLRPRFDKAIESRSVEKTAELFANLVYLSIREKLHRNVKEGFTNHKSLRARLQMARTSYMDTLDANVKKQDPARSAAILERFDKALAALGNPGLFGVGARPPDPAAYKEAVEKIEGLIEKSFPGFKR